MLRMATPAQSNAIRANFHEILQHRARQDQRVEQGGLSNDDFNAIPQKDPKTFNLIAKFLTPEQVQQIVRPAQDNADGQV